MALVLFLILVWLREFDYLARGNQIGFLEVWVNGDDIANGYVVSPRDTGQRVSFLNSVNFIGNFACGCLGNFQLLADFQQIRFCQVVNLGDEIPFDVVLLADVKQCIALFNSI